MGNKFFKSRFGVRCTEGWLPDTFGYCSQLSQILQLCGIDTFFTQKVQYVTLARSYANLIRYRNYSSPGTTSQPSPTVPSTGLVSTAVKFWPT
jgi:hypothetical protein